MNRRVCWPHLLCLLAGAALAFTFPPSPLGALAPLPLALLFRQVASQPPGRAFRLTFAFAASFFTALLLWLPSSLAPWFGPGMAVLYLGLVAWLALGWAAAAALTRRVMGPATLWALPFAWVLLDAARALGPFGFTWGSLGYAFALTPLVQLADLGGVSLVGLVVTLTAAALADGRPRARLGGVLLLVLGTTYGLTRPPDPPGTARALLVQGNVDPRAKTQGRTADELRRYLDLTRTGLAAGPVRLVVWPETAAPAAPTVPEVAGALTALNVPLLMGAPTQEGGYRNSVYAFEAGQVQGRQDKVRLVPFGEYFPGRTVLDGAYRVIFRWLGLPPLSGTVPGRTLAPLPLSGIPVGVLICYESTFPALARALVQRGAQVLAVVSNDAWFGPSVGAEQHFQMGRVRAIETRRWVLRAGNDGVTAVIAPSGRVMARLPRAVAATLPASFGVTARLTPAVRFGEWPVLLSLFTLVGLRLWGGRLTARGTP
ncbi:apolipoprotein N-acyltransferase [Deinococcus sp. YIM 77859]|uniref:apolipoprotein N-acyltransferase n=1 Tax=Deinococcus sp. YIM 77859 TaxID=1540221 RepID=UPI00068AF911|nr:apolipoprotein N-acyltransferase [Deinococcus sp. YIM 77859]